MGKPKRMNAIERAREPFAKHVRLYERAIRVTKRELRARLPSNPSHGVVTSSLREHLLMPINMLCLDARLQ